MSMSFTSEITHCTMSFVTHLTFCFFRIGLDGAVHLLPAVDTEVEVGRLGSSHSLAGAE